MTGGLVATFGLLFGGCLVDPEDHPFSSRDSSDPWIVESEDAGILDMGTDTDIDTSPLFPPNGDRIDMDDPLPDMGDPEDDMREPEPEEVDSGLDIGSPPRDMTPEEEDMTPTPPQRDMNPPDPDPEQDMSMPPEPEPDMSGPEPDMRPPEPQRCIVGQNGCVCGPDQPCEYQQDADPTCKGKACDIVCPGDGNTCKPKAVGQRSVITCRGDNATCEPKCVGDCTVQCEISNGTCKPDCTGGATCTLICEPGSSGTCEFGQCPRGYTSCGNDVYVCHGSCP